MLKRFLSPGMRQGVALVAATTLAYALDYLFNLATGRLLDDPAEFSIIVALAGAGQVLVVASRVVQTVVTRYVAGFQADADPAGRVGAFFRTAFRSAGWWGLAMTALLALLSPAIARFLQIPETGPVLALAAAAWLMAVRPVVGGVLQGEQRFAALGGVQIVQAALRLGLGVALVLAGWGAFGAMAALPLASFVALLFGLWWLGRPVWSPAGGGRAHGISVPEMFRYSAYTAAGLIGYALLVNMDAVLAKRFFTPAAAGDYSAAVTLAKVIQFFPLAIIMILFPKAAQRKAARRDPAGILVAAMAVVGLACGVLATAYYLFPDFFVHVTLGPRYNVEGRVLGTLGLGMALLSLSNVWLNYFLSTERTWFVYLIWIGIAVQAVLMALFHDEMWHLPAIVAFSGLWLTVAGGVAFWLTRRSREMNRRGRGERRG